MLRPWALAQASVSATASLRRLIPAALVTEVPSMSRSMRGTL
jgi:hypothetical protein